MTKYLAVDGYTKPAGLTHQTNNLICLLNLAYNRDRTLIVPRFNLAAAHNRGQALASDLSTYYDYAALTIDDRPCQVAFADSSIDQSHVERVSLDAAAVEEVEGVLWELPQLRALPRHSIALPYQEKIIRQGRAIAAALRPYTCVHVRRTDRAGEARSVDDLGCANILRKIAKCGLKTAYIMSDEDPAFFADLKHSGYDIFLYRDFDALAAIADNYLLYCIELQIMRHATKRVSTFRTLDYPEPGYYDEYLTEAIGWQ